MSRSFVPRGKTVQGFESHMDGYDDIPDGGLAETDAYSQAVTVSRDLLPEGLRISFVDNGNRQIAYIIEWSELACLAYGQNPAVFAGGNWAMVRDDDGSVFPCFVHTSDAFETRVHPRIEPHEARAYLDKGIKSGAVRSDPKFATVFNRLKQATGR